MPRKIRPNVVVLQEFSIDLTANAGDVALSMVCPGDGASVLEWSVIIDTAGVGSAANHNLELEHGSGAAGVALTPVLAVDADATAATITTGNGIQPRPTATVAGTAMQIKNVESASITTGAIVDISVTWQL